MPACACLFDGGRTATASFARGGQMGGRVVAGVALKDDRGRATESGELAVFGDTECGRRAGEHGALHLLLDDGAEAGPGGGEVAGDENDLGSEGCGDETKTTAEMGRLAGDGGDCGWIAFFGQTEEVV